MDIRVQGSGGPRGWPEPGCRCASCLRALSQGISRAPFSVVVGGALVLSPGPPALVPNAVDAGPVDAGALDAAEMYGPPPAGWLPGTVAEFAGHRVARLPGGWEVTGPDGARLLCAGGPGAAPEVPSGAGRYDAVLLDLLGDPAQLGGLRARGLATGATLPVALFADHRVRSGPELARRCRIWRAVLPQDGDTFSVPAPAREAAATSRLSPAASPPAPYGPDRPLRVLVLGGARSGKSAEAELRVAAEPEVTYVATGPAGSGGEWAARIAAHRARRPPWWRTVESTDLPAVIGQAHGAVLVDSITTWLAATMDECGAWTDSPAAPTAVALRIGGLVRAWRQAGCYLVAVSDETGLGIVPGTRAGRMFRDELGRLNQILADESDEVTVVVTGRAHALPD